MGAHPILALWACKG